MMPARLALLLIALFAIGDLRAEDAPRSSCEAASPDVGGVQRAIPKPLPEHPGNIFLASEEVVVPLPADWSGPWRVIDYDGRQIAEGNGPGKISLGKLPVGYYEIPREPGKPPIGIGVLTPLSVPTPRTSPIGVDTSMPWSFANKLPEAASLCALAGVNWARGRFNWIDLEPKQGEFAPTNNYDAAAREMNKAGIQVLQVNGLTPSWAGKEKNRFPADLRDAYRFHREMANRWKGQVQAFEPWNEADWIQFGGHTGAEMASFQKACYWGLKAGNPDVIVCQNVFANYFPEVIADFQENQAWPYFDTLNFHHYWSMDGLPKYYAQFREISGGRPLWVTECNFVPKLSSEGITVDATTHEFDADGLRRQAAHVLQMFAISIQNGSRATFWFILPDFHEGPTQFGALRADMTPRPSYLALATAGRLLADAEPLGRLKTDNKDFWGYLFRARPDGKEQLVLIAWSAKSTEALQLPATPCATFDSIGREWKSSGARLEVTTAPVLAIFPTSLQNQFAYEPAPAMPPRAEGKPSPVVLQTVWPAENSKSEVSWRPDSQYVVGSERPEHMPIYVYNFAETEAKGRLTVTGPEDWNLGIPQDVAVGPLGHVEVALSYDLSRSARRTREVVRIEGDFGPAGKSLLSIRLIPKGPGGSPATSAPSNAPTQPRPQVLHTGDFGGCGNFPIAPVGTSCFYQNERARGGLAFDRTGAYRVFVYALDSMGNAATANLPFLVNAAQGGDKAADANVGEFLFASDFGAGNVYKIELATKKVTTIAEGGGNAGLAFDRRGNLFVAAGNAINKITPDGRVIQFAKNVINPLGLTCDIHDNIYYSTYYDSTRHLGTDAHGNPIHPDGGLYKITPEGRRSTVDSPLHYPYNLSSDASGNVYQTILGHTVFRHAPDGTKTAMFPTGSVYWCRTGILDSKGNLFVLGGSVKEVLAESGEILEVVPDKTPLHPEGFEHPVGLAFDRAGNLYVSDSPSYHGRIYKLTPHGTGKGTIWAESIFLDSIGKQPYFIAISSHDIVRGDLVPGGSVAPTKQIREASIPIDNPSFETGSGWGGASASPSSWTASGKKGPVLMGGQHTSTGRSFRGGPYSYDGFAGKQVAEVCLAFKEPGEAGAAWFATGRLGSFEPDTTYTLTVAVASMDASPFRNAVVGLATDGSDLGSLVASATSKMNDLEAKFGDITVTLDTSKTPTVVGKPISAVLGQSSTGETGKTFQAWVAFDDVRLTFARSKAPRK